MTVVTCHTPAPLFTLPDCNGAMVALADFRGRAHVLVVFNRGFF